ncbi:hypothetical protein Tco_0953737, partial [Tanacetum coccineum]
AIPTPPSSPLTSLSSPLPRIPSPPFHVPSLLPASLTHPLGYRAGMIRLRAESPSTSNPLPLPPPIVLPHTRASIVMMRATAPSTYILAPRSKTPPLGTPPLLPIPLPTSSLHLLLPSTDCRSDVPECSSAPTARPTRGFRVDYGFVGTLDAEIRRDPDREIVSQRMIDFVTTVKQDTYEIYRRLDDAQDDILLMSGQLNLLHRDRRSHARTARLMESEARASHEAWIQSMDASDTTHFETQMAALQSIIFSCDLKKMPPRKASKTQTTRSSPATTTNTTTPMTDEKLNTLIAQGVADVLAERDATRSINGKDSHDSRTGVRRQAPFARECTYPDFMKCKPLYFKGTEGVFELTQCFERMETVFRISNYTMENQIKFATCTLLRSALRGGTPTLELLVKGTNVVGYNQRFQELTLMCARMFLEESDKIKRYVSGFLDMIHGSVMASKPKTMQDAIKFATELMDKKINTFAECQAENKRKFDDTSRNNQNQQQQNKKQNTGRAYTAGSVVNGNAPTKVYAVGHAGTNPDSNVVTGTFLLNNRYASILCTNIDLMPVELGSFDIIIGMDWLAKYQAVIVCAEKIVHDSFFKMGISYIFMSWSLGIKNYSVILDVIHNGIYITLKGVAVRIVQLMVCTDASLALVPSGCDNSYWFKYFNSYWYTFIIGTGIRKDATAPSRLLLLSPDLGFHNNQRFQELALMCAKMFPEESDKIEKYVGGLPDMIHGSVMASKPKTMQDAIKFATELMDKKINTLTERQAENKRKLDKNNQAQ